MEISRHRGLPGGRAVLGGVLMAVAVVGVFVAYEQAGRAPERRDRRGRARPSASGEVLEADRSAHRRRRASRRRGGASTTSTRSSVGSLLGPIGEGEIVQAGSVTDGPATAGRARGGGHAPPPADRGRPAEGGRARRRLRHLRRAHGVGRAGRAGRADRRRGRRLAHERPRDLARGGGAERRRGRRARARAAHRRRHRGPVHLRRGVGRRSARVRGRRRHGTTTVDEAG